MLLWPLVAVLGFLVLAGLVVVLGASSTARYEFERNRAQAERRAAVPTAVSGASGAAPAVSGGSGAAPAVSVASGAAEVAEAAVPAPVPAPVVPGQAQQEHQPQRSAVGVATHPAGRRLREPALPPAWWLVDDPATRSGTEIVAGPFPDRIAAEWAAFSGDTPPTARVEHGVQHADGAWSRRQLPAEKAWLAELGEHLDRLAGAWDDLITDDDALTTLVVEIAAALVESGLPLHDCAADGASGGVCLTPGHGGVLVSWHQHERMSVHQVRGGAIDTVVQRTMNVALAELLLQFGFLVEEASGAVGCTLVRLPGSRD